MLRGAAFSDVLRAMSAPVVELETFRGSVGPWLRAGDVGAPKGWAEAGSELAVPGATGGRVGVCCEMFEGVRVCTGPAVVVGAGAGAGRV